MWLVSNHFPAGVVSSGLPLPELLFGVDTLCSVLPNFRVGHHGRPAARFCSFLGKLVRMCAEEFPDYDALLEGYPTMALDFDADSDLSADEWYWQTPSPPLGPECPESGLEESGYWVFPAGIPSSWESLDEVTRKVVQYRTAEKAAQRALEGGR